jgi:hypothetical protein
MIYSSADVALRRRLLRIGFGMVLLPVCACALAACGGGPSASHDGKAAWPHPLRVAAIFERQQLDLLSRADGSAFLLSTGSVVHSDLIDVVDGGKALRVVDRSSAVQPPSSVDDGFVQVLYAETPGREEIVMLGGADRDDLYVLTSTDHGVTWHGVDHRFERCEAIRGLAALHATVYLFSSPFCGDATGSEQTWALRAGEAPDKIGERPQPSAGGLEELCSTARELLWLNSPLEGGTYTNHLYRSVNGARWTELPLPAGFNTPGRDQTHVRCNQRTFIVGTHRRALLWDPAKSRPVALRLPVGHLVAPVRLGGNGTLFAIGVPPTLHPDTQRSSILDVSTDKGRTWKRALSPSGVGFDIAGETIDSAGHLLVLTRDERGFRLWADLPSLEGSGDTPKDAAAAFLKAVQDNNYEVSPQIDQRFLTANAAGDAATAVSALQRSPIDVKVQDCAPFGSPPVQRCVLSSGGYMAMVQSPNGEDWLVDGFSV